MISSNVYKMAGVEVGCKLPAYTSMGCYPIVYVTERGEPLCAECASSGEYDITDGGIYWEGKPHFCEECSCEIESAYGVPTESMKVLSV